MSIDAEILEAASRWRLRVEDIEPRSGEARELEAWLSRDPRHRAAFEAVGQAWDFFDEVADEPALEAARRRAFAERRPSRPPTVRRFAAAWRAGLAGLALAAGLVVWVTSSTEKTYSTGADQQLSVRLQDGSSVRLDKDTRLTVAFSPTARRLALEAGQAHFAVAHDRLRPFSVTSQGRTVVATGTDFNVDSLPDRLTVALYEGRVRIGEAATGPFARLVSLPRNEVELRPGQAYILERGLGRVSGFDPKTVTAWQSNRLVFDDTPLSVAVARVNRYLESKIELDGQVADLRVSGIFNTGDATGFVEGVTAYLPLEASREPGGAIRLSPKAGRERKPTLAVRRLSGAG